MKTALLSVTDKTGIVEFAQNLVNLDYRIVSTGGTLNTLIEAGVEAIGIEQITGFEEILDGRVKTLHPMVHGGLLYKRSEESHRNTVLKKGIGSIDLLGVNLYDFENTLAQNKSDKEIIENIDIGGPSMLRSAAKNYEDVIVASDPNDYNLIIQKLSDNTLDIEFKQFLALKAFNTTAYYDSMISNYFINKTQKEGKYFTFGLKKAQDVRYGENPHQIAGIYEDPNTKGPLSKFTQINGKELSYNNINDLYAAVSIACEFQQDIVCVAIKHATPCGVAIGKTSKEAYVKAHDADPTSIFGGVLAINHVIDINCANELSKIFLEVIAARDFSPEALEILTKKSNLRLIKLDFDKEVQGKEVKFVGGKVLVQDKDVITYKLDNIVTKNRPSNEELKDLEFAMKVCKHVKSNGIVLAKNGQTVGIGGGQTSRIGALETAVNNYESQNFVDSVMASDGFFPFEDCVLRAKELGVKSIVQPGGSIRDQESISACEENNMAMVFTGVRHFKH